MPPSSSTTRTEDGLEGAELAPEAPHGQLANLAGQLDAGRPGPHDGNGQPPGPLGRVVDHLGHLEGPEDPPPQLEGVVDGLHAGCVQGELVVAEVGLVDAGGDDEAVVGDVAAAPHRERWRAPPGGPGRSR